MPAGTVENRPASVLRHPPTRGYTVIRHLIVCLVLLLLLHGAAGAELTLEDMDAEGGIPALMTTYFRAFNAADETGLRMFLGNHRDATSLARTPLDQRVERQLQFREMFGEIGGN